MEMNITTDDRRYWSTVPLYRVVICIRPRSSHDTTRLSLPAYNIMDGVSHCVHRRLLLPIVGREAYLS
jgi:hypothetical protein